MFNNWIQFKINLWLWDKNQTFTQYEATDVLQPVPELQLGHYHRWFSRFSNYMLGTLQCHLSENYPLKSSAGIPNAIDVNMQHKRILIETLILIGKFSSLTCYKDLQTQSARMTNYELCSQSLCYCNASHEYHYIHAQPTPLLLTLWSKHCLV